MTEFDAGQIQFLAEPPRARGARHGLEPRPDRRQPVVRRLIARTSSRVKLTAAILNVLSDGAWYDNAALLQRIPPSETSVAIPVAGQEAR